MDTTTWILLIVATMTTTIPIHILTSHCIELAREVEENRAPLSLTQRFKSALFELAVDDEYDTGYRSFVNVRTIRFYAELFRLMMKSYHRVRRHIGDWDGSRLEELGFVYEESGAYTRIVSESKTKQVKEYVWLFGRPWICVAMIVKDFDRYMMIDGVPEAAYEIEKGALFDALARVEHYYLQHTILDIDPIDRMSRMNRRLLDCMMESDIETVVLKRTV